MARKVILDVDPGIDDALVLCLALFNPDLEVLAITSVGGNAPAPIAARNMMGVVEFLDPPKLPRIGVGTEADAPAFPLTRSIHGIDLKEGKFLPVAELFSPTPAEKVIGDTIRNHPNQVSVLCLGPLTNIAKAFHRDQELPALIDRLFICGGTYEAPGNVSPSSEFNIFFDPKSARDVFASRSTKTLVPLDVTRRMKFSLDHFASLPAETSRFGKFLRSILLPAFRAYRHELGMEQIYLQELVAYFAMIAPELFLTKEAAGTVETEGTVSCGATIFDRRVVPRWRHNMEVATRIDAESVRARIIESFHETDRIMKFRDEKR